MYKYIKTSFEEAFTKICELAKDFDAHKATKYLKPDYSEPEARQDFIDKFFIALGWDVTHDIQRNPFRQEVKVEKNPDKGKTQRKADYAFHVNPNFDDVCFYVEAKKPSVDIESRQSYFQIIRYGWNTGTPIGILTDFEQFHVIDCRYSPNIDTALEFAIEKFYYTDYFDEKKFARIYYLFSREAVIDGSIGEYANKLPKRRGRAVQRSLFKGKYQDLDETFLAELDDFRERLAKSLKAKNLHFNGHTLTEITQRILDRLVLLRFLEDKNIETKENIIKFGKSGSVWGDFISASRRLDSIYNGIVYKKHSIIDSDEIDVDEDVFADICENLSELNSKYDFNTIPIHILGSIYEQFLGKVITTTNKKAKLEYKPEVKKAGGVYYTPEYIVRYIAENTAGKLIKGKSPNQIAKMRFADISCGSGSFLLGIYGHLLRYHQEWHNKNPDRIKKGDCIEHDDGTYHLSLSTKRKILLNNIYGVDIDPQAVEVAQLSLYLKLLEEETTESARNYQIEIHEAMLPSLDNNIKCGNSLIGPDFYADKDLNLFGEDEMYHINAFDWHSEFKEVMDGGGFDAVIGNPPYFSLDIVDNKSKDYFKNAYSESYTRQSNIYFFFIQKGMSLLKNKGLLGFINERYYLNSKNAKNFRKYLHNNFQLSSIVDFMNIQIFDKVNTLTVINVFSKKSTMKSIEVRKFNKNIRKLNGNDINNENLYIDFKVRPALLTDESWHFIPEEILKIINKLEACSMPLKDLVELGQGIKSGLNDVFVVPKELANRLNLEHSLLRKYVKTKDIQPYAINYCDLYLVLSLNDTVIDKYPNMKSYLTKNIERLKERFQYKDGTCKWYSLSIPQNLKLIENKQGKILTPLYATKNKFAYDSCLDDEYFYVLTDIYILTGKMKNLSMKFLLGLLNSKTLNFYNKHFGKLKRDNYYEYSRNTLSHFPIRTIDFGNSDDVKKHNKMGSLVEKMSELIRKLGAAKTDMERTILQRQIYHTDSQIDSLVYELYGITDEERKIIESAS